MSLLDLWRLFCSGWPLMIAGVLVGLTAAVGYLAVTPEQYEASLLVRVGKVGAEKEAHQIEAPSDVIERLQAQDFKRAVLESLGWNNDGARSRLFVSSLIATSPKDKHVRVGVRGLEADDARRAAEAILSALAGAHRALIEAAVSKQKQELAATADEISDSRALLGHLDRLSKQISPADHDGMLHWLIASQEQKRHLRALIRHEAELRKSLKPEMTRQTEVLGSVVVSASPVHPRARQVWVLAGIGGLLLGVVLVTVRALAGAAKDSAATGASSVND